MRGLANRSTSATRYALTSSAGRLRYGAASDHHCSSQLRQVSSATASATVWWPRAEPAYASSECPALSSHSLRCSYGAMSPVNVAPASSQRGRPPGKSPLSTHSLNGSVTTGHRSDTPVASATVRASSGVVFGVIRSTTVVTYDTDPSSQPASPGSTSSARSRTTRWAIAPLSGRLSHGITARGPASAARRAARPASRRAGAVCTGAVGSARSACASDRTSGRSRSSPPPPPARRRYPASVTVRVSARTSGEASSRSHDAWSVPGYAATTLPRTSKRSPSAARVTSVYRPSCAASACARAVLRPVNAAMPQSGASGACWVYHAWCARKKFPSPRWTSRTGATLIA